MWILRKIPMAVTTLRVVWIEIWIWETDSRQSSVTTLRVVWIEIGNGRTCF